MDAKAGTMDKAKDRHQCGAAQLLSRQRLDDLAYLVAYLVAHLVGGVIYRCDFPQGFEQGGQHELDDPRFW